MGLALGLAWGSRGARVRLARGSRGARVGLAWGSCGARVGLLTSPVCGARVMRGACVGSADAGRTVHRFLLRNIVSKLGSLLAHTVLLTVLFVVLFLSAHHASPRDHAVFGLQCVRLLPVFFCLTSTNCTQGSFLFVFRSGGHPGRSRPRPLPPTP